MVCANCGHESADEFKFCPECGAPAQTPAGAREVRKVVTIVFCDLTGSTAMGDTTDPEALRATMRGYYDEMRKILERHGGTVEKFVGDAVMAVFGAPEPTTDHADRALVAAYAMHAAQAAVNAQWALEGLEPFPLGIGLSTGVVAAALLGSEERLEYTVVGDPVNLCQRLQQFAADGEIVVSDVTWEQLTNKPEAEDLGPNLVKGRTTPVRPHKIASINPIPAAPAAEKETTS